MDSLNDLLEYLDNNRDVTIKECYDQAIMDNPDLLAPSAGTDCSIYTNKIDCERTRCGWNEGLMQCENWGKHMDFVGDELQTLDRIRQSDVFIIG